MKNIYIYTFQKMSYKSTRLHKKTLQRLDECVLQHQHDSNSNYLCFKNQTTYPISYFFLAKNWFVSIFVLQLFHHKTKSLIFIVIHLLDRNFATLCSCLVVAPFTKHTIVKYFIIITQEIQCVCPNMNKLTSTSCKT